MAACCSCCAFTAKGEVSMFREQVISAIKKGFLGKKTVACPGPLQEEHSAEEKLCEEQSLSEKEFTQQTLLIQSGFSGDEIHALCELHQWYQNGGSDRAPVLYHLEFLRRLVANGNLEC